MAVVRAPIPGVLLDVLVRPGDRVAPGDELFIIEAMKMKNKVRANRHGVIGEILATPGATLNYNAPVLSIQEG